MQQIVASIEIRKQKEDRENKMVTSWAVRTLSQFIAAGYQTEDNSKAMEFAGNQTIVDVELMIQNADLPPEPIEPKRGSTETLMRAFSQMRG